MHSCNMTIKAAFQRENWRKCMKQYIIYECENCGKKSKDKTEIIKCEAAHLNLSEEEYYQWEALKQNVRYASHIVSTCKNEQTDKEFDDAIAELIEFEKLHGIGERNNNGE